MHVISHCQPVQYLIATDGLGCEVGNSFSSVNFFFSRIFEMLNSTCYHSDKKYKYINSYQKKKAYIHIQTEAMDIQGSLLTAT